MKKWKIAIQLITGATVKYEVEAMNAIEALTKIVTNGLKSTDILRIEVK